jgi:hypothetical protein
LLLILGTPAHAGTFELSPGTDLQGIFDTIAPGDEVILEDGTYNVTSTLYLREKQASEALPIVIRAADGAAPVLQFGPDLESGEYGGRILQIESSTWIELRGITFRGDSTASSGDQSYGGVRFDNASNIWMVDCLIEELPGTAVYLSGDTRGILLDHTEISRVYAGHGV